MEFTTVTNFNISTEVNGKTYGFVIAAENMDKAFDILKQDLLEIISKINLKELNGKR